MKVKNLITTVSHKIHHHHHHEDDPENSFHLNYEGSSTVEKVKKKSKPIIKEDEFKSKWDQFCDFTSINGFRLLSSKFSWTMRIATATIMFVATCGLFWNVSGAFIKYFNPSGQKNTVVHQGEYEIMDLPKVRFCHQSKNARASVDPDVLSLLHEDSRRLLYLYDIEGVTADMLKREKLPYLYYFMTEANDITFEGRNCISDFYKLQNDCKHVTLYQSYCSIFRSPPNSTNIEDLTVPEMLQAKRDYDNCLVNEYLDSNNNPKSNNIEGFYCCRIKKAFFEFKKIKDENFEEFLSKNNKQELFVWSSSTNFTVTEEWDSLYGKCSTYTLNQFITDNPFDGKPLLSINFLLNTFAFDIMSDDGVIASFVFDNYRANEFVLLPNAQTTIKIKESFDINDYDCTSKYPSLCSDAREPYNDRICEECYNTRKSCHCDNPLRKSDNFGRVKKSICNVHDSILCLLQKTSTGQDVCPNPCISKFYRSLTTLDNFNITLLNVSTDEMTKIKEDFVSTINYLINTIDKTSAVFPLGNHALWEAVYFLEEIFEEFWKILFLVTKLSGKQLPIEKNFTDLIEHFESFSAKESDVDFLIQNYYNYIIDGINSSLENDPTRKEINQRSIEVNLLLGVIPNPPAIINYYRTPSKLQKTFEALNNLKKNIQIALNQNYITDERRNILLKLNALKIFQTDNIKNAEIMKKFQDYLEEFQWYNIEFHLKSLAQLTLSFITKRFSRIEYFQSYTFWNFLSDVGGIMGLYFGLTMVTIYEIITFTFIDREPPESFTRKEKKLTRKTLYPKVFLSDEPIPTLS